MEHTIKLNALKYLESTEIERLTIRSVCSPEWLDLFTIIDMAIRQGRTLEIQKATEQIKQGLTK